MREVVGACPLDCPDGCSWVIWVDERGDAVKLRGNPNHPFTAGGLCKKVNPWLDFASDPDRLLRPLRRVGAKGSGDFEAIGWDDALADIAARLLDVRDRIGGEAIWPFTGTGNVGLIQGAGLPAGARLMNALGASKHSVSICSVSGHVGLGYSQGHTAGMNPEDIAEAGTILLWGTNTLVTNQHLWPFIERARMRGAEVIVIDPVGTRTARRGDLHVALRPGTDGALALTLGRLVRDGGGADSEWITDHTDGFDEFSSLLDDWDLGRGAAICGVEPEKIRRVAASIISAPPLAIKLGQGMQRHAYGGQSARTVSCLAALTGAYGARGGGLVYSTSPAYERNTAGARMDVLAPAAVRTLAMTNLVDVLTGADPPVEALVISGANPVVSNPDSDSVRRALARDDLFTVAIDIYPTPTTAYADYVLPSTMQHEQMEMNDSFSHYYLHWNEPAVAAPGEALSHTDIYRRLATALGTLDPLFTDPVFQADEEDYARALLDTPRLRDAGISVDRLRREGWLRLPDPPPVERFTFVSERAERDGHGRLPDWRPPAESVGETDEYMLVANGSEWHVNTVFSRTRRTLARTDEPQIVVTSADAARDGLVSGGRVEVGNTRGSFTARLLIDDSVARPGVAAISKGWGPQGVNRTVREEDSDMAHGAVFHDNAVRIEPAHPS